MIPRIAAAALLASTLADCSRETPPAATTPITPPATEVPARYKLLTPDEAEKLIATTPDLVILDMRVEEEWDRDGRIKGAVFGNYFRANLEAWLDARDRAKPHFIYCALGERSRMTAQIMHKLNFERVSILDGGLHDWIAAGKPVEK